MTEERLAAAVRQVVIDYIPYPEQLYLEIYQLLYPGEADGSGDDGSGDDGSGDGGPGGFDLDFDDL